MNSKEIKAIADALERISSEMCWLGNGDGIVPGVGKIGALEGLGNQIKEGLDGVASNMGDIAESIRDLAEAIREKA